MDYNFDDLNLDELSQSLNEIEANSFDPNKEVPPGKYEVKIDKIELKTSQKGKPMGFVQMRIVDGEFKKQCLFYNQVLVGTDKVSGQLTAYGIHNFNQFLKSLDSGLTIAFKDFNQYANLLLDVSEKVENLSYLVEMTKKDDFPSYKVKEIYEDDNILI